MECAALIWLALTGLATAQNLPALHDVTDVAGDDVLNVRAQPSADAAIIGTLPPDATGIEVVARCDGWGQVNMGESAGWAALRYLAPQADGAFPQARTLSCFGTEPFWSVRLRQGDSATFVTPESDELPLLSGHLQRAEGRLTGHGVTLAAPGVTAAAMIRRGACTDGMSDRAFGLSVDVILSGAQSRVLAGCCSVVPD